MKKFLISTLIALSFIGIVTVPSNPVTVNPLWDHGAEH